MTGKGVFVELGRSLMQGKFRESTRLSPTKTPGSSGYNSLNWPFPVTGLMTTLLSDIRESSSSDWWRRIPHGQTLGHTWGVRLRRRRKGCRKQGRHGTDLNPLHICDIYVAWSICGTPRAMGAGAVPHALMVSREPTHARFPCPA